MVRIPIEIWEVIRHLGEADTGYAHCSDEQIRNTVETEVNEREGKDGLHFFAGCLVYGRATDSREDQIKRGVEYYQKVRDNDKRWIFYRRWLYFTNRICCWWASVSLLIFRE